MHSNLDLLVIDSVVKVGCVVENETHLNRFSVALVLSGDDNNRQVLEYV